MQRLPTDADEDRAAQIGARVSSARNASCRGYAIVTVTLKLPRPTPAGTSGTWAGLGTEQAVADVDDVRVGSRDACVRAVREERVVAADGRSASIG
jgi:hypothetical protein